MEGVLKVYKYEIENKESVEIPILKNAKFLSLQQQGNKTVAWFQVRSFETETELRTFYTVWTGEEFYASIDVNLIFLGTVQNNGMVSHIFELKK